MQVLEPVDDLAKQFSDVMVISIVAILLQRLLLGVSQAWAFTCVLPTGCVLLVVSLMLPRWPLFGARLAALGRMLIVLALFARFSVLAAGLAGEVLTAGFLNHDLDSAMAVMQRSGGSLDQFTQPGGHAPAAAGHATRHGILVRPAEKRRSGDHHRHTILAERGARLGAGRASPECHGRWPA